MLDLVVHDYDSHFQSLKFPPIILNDLPPDTLSNKSILSELIYTTVDKTDLLDSIPRCACGRLSYGINEGTVCTYCGTRVEAQTEQEIESTVWIRAPEGIKGLIHPLFWMIVCKGWVVKKFNVLRWFLSPTLSKPKEQNKKALSLCRVLEETGIPRGLNSFIENFDQLIPFLVFKRDPERSRRRDTKMEEAELLVWLNSHKHLFFPKHLPVPNRIMFIKENTHTGNYTDFRMKPAINACLTANALQMEGVGYSKKLETQIVSITADLAEYYDLTLGKPFGRKKGYVRRMVSGVSPGFSLRTVIVSDSGVHNYDEIRIPYPQACTMLRLHILNKLRKRGFPPAQMYNYVIQHTATKDPLMLEIINELIAEGVYVLWIRYPTLKRASLQFFRVGGLNENSSTISVLCMRGPNADRVWS